MSSSPISERIKSVSRWLDSIPDCPDCSDSSIRPNKRKRTMAPTPAASEASGRPRSPLKRPRKSTINDEQRTPKAGRGGNVPAPSVDLSEQSSLFSASLTGPSEMTGQTREQSPTRNKAKRSQLKITVPSFVIGIMAPAPLYSVTAKLPPHILRLVKKLSGAFAVSGCIPADIAEKIDKLSQGLEPIPDHAIDRTGQVDADFKFVIKIYKAAGEAYRDCGDEATWSSEVILEILKTGLEDLKIVPAESKTVHSSLLPLLNSKSIGSVKVDKHIALLCDETTAPLIAALKARVIGGNISAFTDGQADDNLILGLVEIKQMSSDYEEGVYQFTVASSAMREKMQCLTQNSNCTHEYAKTLPILGIIVYGHFWNIHISYREENGTVRVLGPYSAGGTATILDIFCLLKVLDEAQTWLTEEYWPFLKDLYGFMVSEPVADRSSGRK